MKTVEIRTYIGYENEDKPRVKIVTAVEPSDEPEDVIERQTEDIYEEVIRLRESDDAN